MESTRLQIAQCPACDTRIRFHQVPLEGDVQTCPECDSQLEVIRSLPLKLACIRDLYEDWQDSFAADQRPLWK